VPGRLRLVILHTVGRDGKPQVIRLLTSLSDVRNVAAHVIAEAYRLRWQIELFFKWLKTFARLDHLLSTSRRGITTQLYIAVIAVLLMHVQCGRRVSIYALAALGRVASGQMPLAEAMAIIARRERERARNRARQARLRARKKLA
jgi:Transposase DDE domain